MRDVLFAILGFLEGVGDLESFKLAIEALNWIANQTQDFQKKPIISMVEWKYYIRKDFQQANQKYQEAKMMAQMLGNEQLTKKLDEEWQTDLKRYL